MSNPFEYLNSVSYDKLDLSQREDFQKEFIPFLVNRGLSYHKDTVLIANEINRLSQLPLDMQYKFLLNTIRPRKRFSKWFKKDRNELVLFISKYYGINNKKAAIYLSILTDKQFEQIKIIYEESNKSDE